MTRRDRHFYEFGPFRIDPVKRILLREGDWVPLAPKVFDILLVLVQQNGEIVEKDELLDKVWPDTFVEEGNLHVNISALRKALGDDGNQNQYIRTIPKRGYRFVAGVTEIWEGAEPAAQFETSDQGPAADPADIRAVDVESGGAVGQPDLGAFDRPSLAAAEVVKKDIGWRPTQPVLASSVLLLCLAAAFAYLWGSDGSRRTITITKPRSLAVLPFKIVSGDPGDEHLGAGVADSIAIALTNVRQLTVRPLRASLKYPSASQDPVEAGRALQVDAVLEGSIRRVGDSLRMTAQLVRVDDGLRLWEHKSSDEFESILTVQNTIPQQIATALALELTDQEKMFLSRRHTDNLEAFRVYLKARHMCSQRSWKQAGLGIEFFEQAIKVDPNYAPAYSGLAYTHMLPINPLPTMEKMHKAKAAALKALDLDDSLAEAHTALGRAVTYLDWDWAAAEKEFRRAIELNPNYVEAHFFYSLNLSALGRHDEAIEEMKLAQEIDPFHPRNTFHLGWSYYMARDYDQAIDHLRKTPFEVDSAYHQVYWRLGLVYVQKAMYDEAITMLQKAGVLSGDMPLAKASIGYAYAKSGNVDEARRIIAELSESSKLEEAPITMAAIYACLGDNDSAFEWLERAYAVRGSRIIDVKTDPMLDDLRSDPRFGDLLRRLSLTP